MAILAYDDVMLREPRLLVPRLMPIGAVKLDRNNPLAPDYRCLIARPPMIDLQKNSVGTSGTAPTFAVKPAGTSLAISSATTTAQADADALYPLTPPMTALAFVSTTAPTTAGACWYECNLSSSVANGAGSVTQEMREIHFGVGVVTSGQWGFCGQWGDGTGGSVYVEGGTAVTDVPAVLVAVSPNNASNLFYVDGVYIGASAHTGKDETMPSPVVERFGDVGYTSAGRYWRGNLFALMVWRRVLSAGEIAALSANPFQVLIPA